MNVYKFETLHEFGYAKDPHTVFMIVRAELKNVYSYSVTDGFKDVDKSEFRFYPNWCEDLKNDGEVYYELYGKKKSTDTDSMLGVIKIERFCTVD